MSCKTKTAQKEAKNLPKAAELVITLGGCSTVSDPFNIILFIIHLKNIV